MHKRKNIPKKARKNRSIIKAREFILKSDIKWLPVNPREIYQKYSWLLLTWDEAKTILKHEDPLFLKKYKVEARTSMIKGSDMVLTIYDSSIIPFTRIRWTLAHEIGHIVLGHLEDFEETAINRGGLSSAQYKVLEDEADFFAAELLEPMPILKKIGAYKAEEIIKICNVSLSAAKNRSIDLDWWGNKTIAFKYDKELCAQFSLYLKPVSICMKLNEAPIKSLLKQNHGRSIMESKKYLYIETDENNRYLECPRCGNNVFSKGANYCKICGLYLYNDCSNIQPNIIDNYCGKTNPGDARYCEYCGSPTSLMNLGLLMSWEEIIQSGKEVAAAVVHSKAKEEKEEPPFDCAIPF